MPPREWEGNSVEHPQPLRGEIWMFDLNPKKGREQRACSD
jgi:hypothetical protein